MYDNQAVIFSSKTLINNNYLILLEMQKLKTKQKSNQQLYRKRV